MSEYQAARRNRQCPHCATCLQWRETQQLMRVTFDYYDPCESCGTLACYNRREGEFVYLREGYDHSPRLLSDRPALAQWR